MKQLSLTLSIFLFAFSAFGASTTLGITFGDHRVTVSGVRSHHTIILFGVGLGRYSYSPLLTRYTQAAADDDGDGKTDFTVRMSPSDAVWIGVDLEDGDYAIATPTGAPVVELPVSPNLWRAGGDHVDFGSEYLDVVVVRPHIGAWALNVADGGRNDADDRVNGALRLRLDRMQPLAGKETGPPVVTGRDLIFAIDCNSLKTYVRQAE